MTYELRQLSAGDGKDVFDMLHEIPQEENGFCNAVHAMNYDEYREWLVRCDADSKQVGVRYDGRVPQTTFWLYADGIPVGYGKVRHCLTDRLLLDGGNIGYAVRPSARGMGHGKVLLGRLLGQCADLGIDKALVTIDKDNYASLKVALFNGGAVEKTTPTLHYVWIDCKK